jgi:hypothetical protein
MNWERRRRYMFVEEDKENDETCEKKMKSVAKETVLVVTLFNFCIYCKICFLLKGGEVISTNFVPEIPYMFYNNKILLTQIKFNAEDFSSIKH